MIPFAGRPMSGAGNLGNAVGPTVAPVPTPAPVARPMPIAAPTTFAGSPGGFGQRFGIPEGIVDHSIRGARNIP